MVTLSVLAVTMFSILCACEAQVISSKHHGSDGLLIQLVNAVTKLTTQHALDIKDLENKLQKQEDKLQAQDEKLKKQEDKLKEQENKLQKQEERHVKEIKRIEKEQHEEITELKNEYKHDIDYLKITGILQTTQPIVAFHVVLTKSQSSVGKVEFDKIISNHGNCWNSITDTFKAPTKGLYFFTLTIMNGNKNYVDVKIMRENSNLQFTRVDGAHLYNMGTASAVVLLNAGEHVYAEIQYGVLYSDPTLYTHFVGFLIQAVN